jgi:hypothetical protein
MKDSHLQVHLFKGYLACTDQAFVSFVTNIQHQALYQNVAFTTDTIMSLTLNFYSDRVRNKLWNKLSEDKEQILAMTAEIKALRSKGEEKKKKKKESKDKDGKNEKKGKKKGKKSYEWKQVAPKEGEPKAKKVGGKDYHWCPKHKAWTVHSPDECKLEAPKTDSSKDSKKKKGKLQLNKALSAIMEASEGDSDSE